MRAERASLTTELADLTEAQWAQPSLCTDWSVEDVVAHLVAGASTGMWGWTRSVVGARFDFDLHNNRLINTHRGATPTETLPRIRGVCESSTAPWNRRQAWHGEIVLRANDIRRPFGIPSATPVELLTPLAAPGPRHGDGGPGGVLRRPHR